MNWIMMDPDDLHGTATRLSAAADEIALLDSGLSSVAASCCAPPAVAAEVGALVGVARSQLGEACGWLCSGAADLRGRADLIAADASLVGALAASWDGSAAPGVPAVPGGTTVVGGDLFIGAVPAAAFAGSGLTVSVVGGGGTGIGNGDLLIGGVPAANYAASGYSVSVDGGGVGVGNGDLLIGGVPAANYAASGYSVSVDGGAHDTLYPAMGGQMADPGPVDLFGTGAAGDAYNARMDQLLISGTTPGAHGTYVPDVGAAQLALFNVREDMARQLKLAFAPEYSGPRTSDIIYTTDLVL